MRHIVSSLHQELISVLEFRSEAETANLELVEPVRDQDTCRRVALKRKKVQGNGEAHCFVYQCPPHQKR
jgi:hypothetical protein